ncbi:unnamed protein product [Prorocentrum cordatum]|uniref:Uncharacterized protein n=1 Tax=Prorocentrum cordatum TaxID=2364126 RepID=A0ABN9UHV3_9DINO|nr:unnamed protein product [Polarella glacialis]
MVALGSLAGSCPSELPDCHGALAGDGRRGEPLPPRQEGAVRPLPHEGLHRPQPLQDHGGLQGPRDARGAELTDDVRRQGEQTLIILDWDDTLFPSTFVRSDMHLKLSMPLRDQKLPAPVKKQVFNSLLECAANAEKLLRLCASYGKVVIVTLAKGQWVTDSCKFFYPGIGDLLKKLDVKIVYAQDGVSIDHDQLTVMDVQNLEAFWGGIKGKAISDEIKNFYSRYEGQSWKNIISIGDSNFEKIGTMNATADYMREKGIEVPSDLANISTESGGVSFRPSEAATVVVRDHALHVRTKVAKMLDEPTVDELQVELELMRQWLPLMVKHDGGFSMDLDGLKGWEDRKSHRHRAGAARAPAGRRPGARATTPAGRAGPQRFHDQQLPEGGLAVSADCRSRAPRSGSVPCLRQTAAAALSLPRSPS